MGGTRSRMMSSGAFDRPANRRPAASDTADEGASRRTGPASELAAATAALWSGVSTMRSVSSSMVRCSSFSGPVGYSMAAPDSGMRFAPLASSIAAPDRSTRPSGMCSVNIIESVPVPMSSAGIVPGRRAGGVESLITERFAPASPANALSARSAMPAAPVDAIRSGPAVSLDIASEAVCASVNKSRTRAPSPSDSTDDGDWRPAPFLSSTAISCGRTFCIAMYSSNSSASVPVPRFSTGTDTSDGAVPSSATASATPDAPGASLPDTSAAAPGAMSIVTASPASEAAATAATSRAFWPCVSVTVTVSFTASMPCAPSSRMRSDPAATVNRPASSPPSGADTYSSYTMSSLPAPRSRTVRFPPISGRAGMGAVESAVTLISLLVEPKYRPSVMPLTNDPRGTSSFASGPVATAAAFCAAVRLMMTISLNIPNIPFAVLTAAPSSGTVTPLPCMVTPVRLVRVRYAHSFSMNSTSSIPVFRSRRTDSSTMEVASWLLCSGALPPPPPCGPSSISPLWPGGKRPLSAARGSAGADSCRGDAG